MPILAKVEQDHQCLVKEFSVWFVTYLTKKNEMNLKSCTDK